MLNEITYDIEDAEKYCQEHMKKSTTEPPWLFSMAIVWIKMLQDKITRKLANVQRTLKDGVADMTPGEYEVFTERISNRRTALDGIETLCNHVKSREQASRDQWEQAGKSCEEQMGWAEAIKDEHERLRRSEESASEADVKEARCALQNYSSEDPCPRAIKELLDYREYVHYAALNPFSQVSDCPCISDCQLKSKGVQQTTECNFFSALPTYEVLYYPWTQSSGHIHGKQQYKSHPLIKG